MGLGHNTCLHNHHDTTVLHTPPLKSELAPPNRHPMLLLAMLSSNPCDIVVLSTTSLCLGLRVYSLRDETALNLKVHTPQDTTLMWLAT